jgi:glycosyltransferase involved in cell wall biosynthesis
MRILMVNETGRVHTGGINRVAVETCRWLRAAGHEVAVAYWREDEPELVPPLFKLPDTASLAPMRAAMLEVAKQFNPDVVQLHQGDNPYFLHAIAADLPVCRYIHDQSWFCSGGDRMARDFTPCHRPHGVGCLPLHYLQGCGGRHPVGNWRRWQLIQQTQMAKENPRFRWQVASEFMRRGMLENGYRAEQVDLVRLAAETPKINAAIEPGLLLVASRLVRSKGVDYLLRAVARLRGSDWRLVVAGAGPEQESLLALRNSLGLQSQVEFVGELSPVELEPWFARCSVLVTPTLRPEPFGLVGVEAMAHGKPVVAFPGGATDEWLVDGETGLLARSRTPDALADALATLLRQPELGLRLGVQARQRWEQYRPDVFVNQVVQSFERCLNDFEKR